MKIPKHKQDVSITFRDKIKFWKKGYELVDFEKSNSILIYQNKKNPKKKSIYRLGVFQSEMIYIVKDRNVTVISYLDRGYAFLLLDNDTMTYELYNSYGMLIYSFAKERHEDISCKIIEPVKVIDDYALYLITKGGKTDVISETGNVIFKDAEKIMPIDNLGIAFYKERKFYLQQPDGSQKEFDYCKKIGSDATCPEKFRHKGYLIVVGNRNKKGTLLLYPVSDGYLVDTKNSYSTIEYINLNQQRTSLTEREEYEKIFIANSGRFDFLNANGEKIIKYSYFEVMPFNYERAFGLLNDKNMSFKFTNPLLGWHMIDMDGNLITVVENVIEHFKMRNYGFISMPLAIVAIKEPDSLTSYTINYIDLSGRVYPIPNDELEKIEKKLKEERQSQF